MGFRDVERALEQVLWVREQPVADRPLWNAGRADIRTLACSHDDLPPSDATGVVRVAVAESEQAPGREPRRGQQDLETGRGQAALSAREGERVPEGDERHLLALDRQREPLCDLARHARPVGRTPLRLQRRPRLKRGDLRQVEDVADVHAVA
jgi:hypothetical protein